VTAFAQALQQLGWSVGQNVRLLYRWGDGTSATMQKYATELVALAADVILADSSAAVAPLLQATKTIPIVFAIVGDPPRLTRAAFSTLNVSLAPPAALG
jgi:putative tryptophan/tyrosine transport system substrate-binding protein